MIIDTRNSNFFVNEDIKDLYNSFYLNSKQTFKDQIAAFFRKQEQDIFTNLSLTQFGHPKYTNIYKDYCILLTLNEYDSKLVGPIKIIIDSYLLALVLKEIKFRNQVKIVYKPKNIKYLEELRNFFKKTFFFIKKIYQVILVKALVERLEIRKENVLYEVFLSNRASHERYYGNLKDFLNAKQKKDTVFLPILIDTQFGDLLSLISSFRKSSENWLFREHYLGIKEIFYAVFYKSRLKRKLHLNVPQNSYEVFFHHSFVRELFSSLISEGILNYFFLKNIKKVNKNNFPNIFIDWWENSPMDKGMFLGTNHFFKEIEHKAFLGIYPNLNSLQFIAPSKEERENSCAPKKILVIGNYLINFLASNFTNAEIVVSPSFRGPSLQKTEQMPTDNKILVILPIFTKSSINIIQLLKSSFPALGEKIIFRLHPASDIEKLTNEIIKSNFLHNNIDSSRNLETLIKSADTIICGESSVIIQALMMSKRVVVVNDDPFNPINMTDTHFESCTYLNLDIEKNRTALVEVLATSPSIVQLKPSNKENFFFMEPTQQNVNNILLGRDNN